MDIKDFHRLKELLSAKEQRIVITSHSNPDGDAIGSCIALSEYLKIIGFSVNVIVPNPFPSFLAWLKSSEDILIFEEESEKSKKIIESADILFSLDYNDFQRTGEMEKELRASKAVKVLIDHHLEPCKNFDISLSKIQTSSTSELIYEFIDFMEHTNMINKEIAESLYVGIITDTGSLSYSSDFPSTYKIIAHLVEKGIETERIQKKVYVFSENRLRLLGYCLSERLTVLKQYATAYIFLTRDDLDRFDYKTGDTEGVVNYALNIEGVHLAALFTERENYIRISLRSKGDLSVNDFARKYYEGGGHKNAAGANSYKNMDETLNEFIERIKNFVTYEER